MFKRIATIIAILLIGLFVTVTAAHAAVSVRLQEKTASTNNNFNLTFVTLDTDGFSVTVKCFKKGPSDGAFSQFGSDIVVSNGGNTNSCAINSSVVTGEGTYEFKVVANNNNGSGDVASNTIAVDVKTGNPGTPINYSKDKIGACDYKIHFRTADDNGKTVKVEVYRSENKSFNADAGTRVASIALGSNTNHDFVQSVPDCNKTYYYAVRAFDSAGNGSGVTGDSETVVTLNTINQGTTTQQSGAIPVSSANQTNVGGSQTSETGEETAVSPTGSEEGSEDEVNDEEQGVKGTATEANSNMLSTQKLIGFTVVVAAAILVYWLLRRRFSK